MTHICVSKLTNIGSDNGLSPGRRQAIIWTNAGILLIGPLGTNFSVKFNRNSNVFIQENGLENGVCEMASILSRPQYVKSRSDVKVFDQCQIDVNPRVFAIWGGAVWSPGSVFCLLLRVSLGYAQPITVQVTEVTCPVIGQAQPELTPSKGWAQMLLSGA